MRACGRCSRLLVLCFLVLGLPTVPSGCARVAANYPPSKLPRSELPAEHKTRSGDHAPVVWERSGTLRGFLVLHRHTAEREADFRKLAAVQPMFAAEADLFAGLAAEDLAELVLAVYLVDGAKVRAKTGDFVVRYADGTEVRDAGILYVEPRDAEKRRRLSREGALTLSNEPVGKGKPLTVMLFVPAADLDKTVAAVELADRG